jgi:hypothetical protein
MPVEGVYDGGWCKIFFLLRGLLMLALRLEFVLSMVERTSHQRYTLQGVSQCLLLDRSGRSIILGDLFLNRTGMSNGYSLRSAD